MRNTEFAAFLLECEANPLCRRQHLKELLPNPLQRVTRYPLLIQQIQKYTDPDLPEFGNISVCLEKIRSICSNINNEVAQSEARRIEKAVRAKLLADDMSREVGDAILNIPVFCDDIKLAVNLVLFERYIVLFPNEKSMLFSSTSSSTSSESCLDKSTRIIPIHEEDILISADKKESKSFYLISKSKNRPLICPIICKTEDECQRLTQTLEKVNKKKGAGPVVEFLDLEVAQVHERNRPPSLPAASEDDEGLCGSIEKRGGDSEFTSFNSTESWEGPDQAFQQRIDKIDSQIFTLLTHKLSLMQEQYGARKLPAGARDLPQSLSQLTSDANNLHEVAVELLEPFTGQDKNAKFTRIRSSFQSLVANVEFISGSVLWEHADQDQAPPSREDMKLRRGSFFERILPWKGRDQDQGGPSPDPNPSSGVVHRRSNKKYSRSRANTNSPAPNAKPSPRSSNESLNKVNCNRLSSCSHHSTDSEVDCDGCRVRSLTPRSLGRSTARSKDNRTSTLQDLFRRSQVMSTEKPIITGPVLQHTTNKLVTNNLIDNG